MTGPRCTPDTAHLFEPLHTGESTWAPRIARAKEGFCSKCELRDACLEAGRKGKESGIWGGVMLDEGRIRREPIPDMDIETARKLRAQRRAGIDTPRTRAGEAAYEKWCRDNKTAEQKARLKAQKAEWNKRRQARRQAGAA